MPKIAARQDYNGATEKLARLGMQSLWNELESILTGFKLRVLEKKDSNGGKAVRMLIDERFVKAGGWANHLTGDVDWIKCAEINGTRVCLGVEIQCSARSDLLIVDVSHLTDRIIAGNIDVGVLVVPSDTLAVFLTDRVARFADALVAVKRGKAEDMPLIVLGIEHDGPGPALKKQAKR